MTVINSTLSTTSVSTPATYLNKTFYDKKLLEIAKTKWKHAQFGQKRTIPANNGKTVEFRKFELFTPDTTPITEGVVSTGQQIEQSHIEATVAQYGKHVMITDMLDLTAYDPVASNMVELLGEQVGTSIDWVTRDAMNAGTNVQYANSRTSRLTIVPGDKLTFTEIRKAVRALKKAKAPMFSRNGREHYVCIVSPDAVFDLQGATEWVNVATYSDKEQIYTGEIGMMFGVVFVESTEAKIFAPSVANAVNATTSSATEFVLKNTPTDAEVEYLSTGGNKLYINGSEVTLASSDSYTAATKTVKLSSAASLTANHLVYSQDAGACDSTSKICCDVHSSLIFGMDAYGVIDIGGKGAMRTIIKPKGSAGTADPYDQFSTIAVKVEAYTAKILQPLWIRRIEHGVTA